MLTGDEIDKRTSFHIVLMTLKENVVEQDQQQRQRGDLLASR